MRSLMPVALLFVSGVAFAQSRTFHLDHPPAPEGYEEIATVLRTLNSLRLVSDDTASQSVTVSGSSVDLITSEWLIQRLDHSAGDPEIAASVVYQYAVPGPTDDVLRVFYLRHAESEQGAQELLTALRTVVEVQKVFGYTPLHAIAMRGPAAKVAMAAWLIEQLDVPAADRTVTDTSTHEFSAPARADDIARVFYLRSLQPGALKDALTEVRMNARIQRAYLNTAARALIVRGTADQMAMAERLVGRY